MAIAFPPLPYAADALEPHISAETLGFHHGKHHKAYVDKANAALDGTDQANAPLEDIVRAAHGNDVKLYQNAAQAWNHGFYWNCLSPDAAAPSDAMHSAIDAAFGSFDVFKSRFVDEALAHFGSGWVWLTERDGQLAIESLHDADTPLVTGGKALLTLDVWEHAYYLDRQNDRKAYAVAVMDNLIDWSFAERCMNSEDGWKYPSGSTI